MHKSKMIPTVFASIIAILMISGILSRPLDDTRKNDDSSPLMNREVDAVNHVVENSPVRNESPKPPENISNSDGDRISEVIPSESTPEHSSTSTSTDSQTSYTTSSTESSHQSHYSDYPYSPSSYYPQYLATIPMLPGHFFQRPQPYAHSVHHHKSPRNHHEYNVLQHSSNSDPNLSQPISPFVNKFVLNVTNHFN